MTSLLPVTKAEIERLANTQKLEQWQHDVASAVAARRETITSLSEADTVRRELQVLIKAFQAKRIDAKECRAEERRFEILMGKLLGEPKVGRPTATEESLPGKDLLNDRYKNEFRRMAEHEEAVEDLLAQGKTDRKPIVRTVRALEEAAARSDEWPEHSLEISSCRDLVERVEQGSVDAVITDPPYPRAYLDCYSELSEFASHALKDGGLCVALAGQSYLPEVLTRLGEHLTYHWLGAYLMPGGQSSGNRARGVNAFWKPICIFVKGKYEGSFGDVVRSEVNDNDAGWLHEWGQSESGTADLVRRFSLPHDLVADPFMGSGTVALQALLQGRRVLGADIDPASVETVRKRLRG